MFELTKKMYANRNWHSLYVFKWIYLAYFQGYMSNLGEITMYCKIDLIMRFSENLHKSANWIDYWLFRMQVKLFFHWNDWRIPFFWSCFASLRNSLKLFILDKIFFAFKMLLLFDLDTSAHLRAHHLYKKSFFNKCV